MDFVEFLVSLSWREILMAIVVLLVLYIMFIFLSISRLRGPPPMPELSPDEPRNIARKSKPIKKSGTSKRVKDEPPKPEPKPFAPEPKPEPGPAFAYVEPPVDDVDPERVEILEQDLTQLRQEIGRLRAELRTLREERQETEKIRAARDTSPFYSDAMQLAMQGNDAANISASCGISRAEAELLVALAKNAQAV